MSTYQFASGYNNTGSLVDVDPQPNSPGMQEGRRQQRGDGSFVQDGYYKTSWNYGYLTHSQYSSLLTAFGLTGNTLSAACTVTNPKNVDRTFGSYNAIIVRPNIPDEGKQTMGRWLEVTFQIIRMEEVS